MRWIKTISLASIPFLCGVFCAGPADAAVTNPAPNQVFATGTAAVDFGWDPVEGADSYELELLFNDTAFDSIAGITATTQTLFNLYAPGYYTVLVRGVNTTSNGPWSDPVTFIVQRTMMPGDGADVKTAPAVFKWTRSEPANRYRLRLSQYDKSSGAYILKQKLWIPQPVSGSPKWIPPSYSLPPGKFRWSITDYAGDKAGYTSVAYFTVFHPPAPGDYLVIDLSGGPGADDYPVTHRTGVPAGGWTDLYKTTRLVMRKVSGWSFIMGSPADELGRESNETRHPVTLTKDFYIGVFEVTQRQWELVMNNRPGYFNNPLYYATRPVELVSYDDVRGPTAGARWPYRRVVDAASFMGRLRAKTGLTTLDLPTEAQWEYACRAGRITALNSGENLTNIFACASMNAVGRYWHNGGRYGVWWRDGNTSVGTAKAGSYLPNAWGLYDMHGNVWEWCLDWLGPYAGPATDPKGAAAGPLRVGRGGRWSYDAKGCRSAYRNGAYSSYRGEGIGFRMAMNLP